MHNLDDTLATRHHAKTDLRALALSGIAATLLFAAITIYLLHGQ